MIHHGDCLDVMATLEPESVSAIVTDPPYGIGFMGKAWDSPAIAAAAARDAATRKSLGPESASRPGRAEPRSSSAFGSPAHYAGPVRGGREWQEWCYSWAVEAFRVAKPGAHLLAFGGTRTFHRLASAIEDAGWEIRDTLVWAYASGFPKSLDVSKAIDKASGATREKVAVGEPVKRMIPGADQNRTGDWTKDDGRVYQPGVELPATEDAARWQGWGTALKPAWEPIVMARKPLRGTVAGNVLAFGTGALNIDGTRIGYTSESDRPTQEEWNRAGSSGTAGANGFAGQFSAGMKNAYAEGKIAVPPGRWPANVILTDPIFDGGIEGVVGGGYQESTAIHGAWQPRGLFPIDNPTPTFYGDSGTYSRFFLIPKSARSEREPIAGSLPRAFSPTMSDGIGGREHSPADARAFRQNVHPTVKPVELMRHLIRLVTPPGGIVLDPFLGSGTTAIAAEMEGFGWIGIEREAEYVAIAQARLVGVQKGLGLSA